MFQVFPEITTTYSNNENQFCAHDDPLVHDYSINFNQNILLYSMRPIILALSRPF